MAICPECQVVFDDKVQTCPDHGCELLPDDLFAASAEETIEAGTMVGEYRIQKKLGSGTFGDVYAGEHPLIGKRVAVKVLSRRFASDPAMVSRFVAEARAVNKIRQRNIIDIFSFGVLPGLDRHYFVMELLDGLTLGELLDRKGRLPIPTVLSITQGIAEALDAVHDAGITHRDLKPDNVFLATERDGSYFPKLLDFGIAKLLDDESAHKTGPGMVLGTPRYMSPEQARGKPADRRADIYALGVMIHEMLTGQAPFAGQSSVDVLLKHTAEPPPRISEVSPDLPAELDAPILAMLEKRPADRPASAGEAVRAFAQRVKRLGLDRVSALPPPAERRPASRSDGGPDSEEVWSSPTVVDRPAPAAGREGETLVAPATRRSPAPDEGAAAKSANGGRAADERTEAMPSGPRSSANPGPRGPSTEELSVIETDGRRIKTGWSSRLKIGVAVSVVAAIGSTAWAISLRSPGASSTAPAAHEASPPPTTTASSAPVITAVNAPSPSGTEPQVKPSDALPQTIELRVATRPTDVEVWQGTVKLGTTPGPLSIVRGSDRIELSLRKPGYKDETVALTPDHDQSLDASLTPLGGRKDPGPGKTPGKTPGKLDRILGDRE